MTEQWGSVLCHRSNSYLSFNHIRKEDQNRGGGKQYHSTLPFYEPYEGIDQINTFFLISWCKLSTSAIKGIILSFWLLIMKATGFDFVCHIKQSHTRSYINNITFFVAWIRTISGMRHHAPYVLCILICHPDFTYLWHDIYDNNNNLIQSLISYWPTLEKEEPPDGMAPWCQFEDWHLTTYIASKKGQPRAGQKEEKSHGRENSLCFMNSCLSWFGHPERKHGPGQPEIFPRDSYHLSEKSRLKNRPGAAGP